MCEAVYDPSCDPLCEVEHDPFVIFTTVIPIALIQHSSVYVSVWSEGTDIFLSVLPCIFTCPTHCLQVSMSDIHTVRNLVTNSLTSRASNTYAMNIVPLASSSLWQPAQTRETLQAYMDAAMATSGSIHLLSHHQVRGYILIFHCGTQPCISPAGFNS